MRPHLKSLREQVIVITGASSGIGLATAKLAAQRGACVVLTARHEEALRNATDEINAAGGKAAFATADVADESALTHVATVALERFGRIDTWVNNAGVSIYGNADQVTIADMRRLFDVTFWGVVHGCRIALPHLRGGGALINIGSVESELALPLSGVYAAAKHAVKGYTDALRIELAYAKLPISLTLVKPASIDTPFFEHAKSYMEAEPRPAPPVYAPEVVARTVLRCAEHPVRDILVGGSGRTFIGLRNIAPRFADWLFAHTMFDMQKGELTNGATRPQSLYAAPPTDGEVRGRYPGHVMRSSLYTLARLHPYATLGTMALVAGGAVWTAMRA